MEETEEVEEEEEELVEEEEAVEEEAEKAEEVEAEVEAEKPREEEKEEVEEIVEERIYTIPLQKAWIRPRKKRSPRAIRIVREFIQRHMKTDDIIIKNEVNELIWAKGIEKPPRNIRVRVTKDKEGVVTLHRVEGR